MKFEKYFWDLKEEALRETKKILKDTAHPQFIPRIVTLLSRCDKTKELFSIITKDKFIETWPQIRAYWIKRAQVSDFRDWWQTIYEQLLDERNLKQKKSRGNPPEFFQKFGNLIKEARINKGLSQSQLAHIVGMKQPDISRIEEGKKNVTLYTLMRLCKILEIKKIEMS